MNTSAQRDQQRYSNQSSGRIRPGSNKQPRIPLVREKASAVVKVDVSVLHMVDEDKPGFVLGYN